MDPHARRDDDNLQQRDFADDEGEYLGDLTDEELMAVLKESEESGICDQSLEEIFDELFEKHFGRKPTPEERSVGQSD